jgi:hypothetical protein
VVPIGSFASPAPAGASLTHLGLRGPDDDVL